MLRDIMRYTSRWPQYHRDSKGSMGAGHWGDNLDQDTSAL